MTVDGDDVEGVFCVFAAPAARPQMSHNLWGDHERFEQDLFSCTPLQRLFTSPAMRVGCDAERANIGSPAAWMPVITVLGARMGTVRRVRKKAPLVAHPKVAEAAVVGFPH